MCVFVVVQSVCVGPNVGLSGTGWVKVQAGLFVLTSRGLGTATFSTGAEPASTSPMSAPRGIAGCTGVEVIEQMVFVVRKGLAAVTVAVTCSMGPTPPHGLTSSVVMDITQPLQGTRW